ncbi:hypothetical protein L596_021298 [Steinernema carpocapsae]|uniref:Uncharacterized protein n=1 Tax=Steinernema carpocapsae TaxID=34508 RepID=A0A4U5MID1_STECR|nr:hypothetical protein L596_021298 [Steinernema carpocapsae]
MIALYILTIKLAITQWLFGTGITSPNGKAQWKALLSVIAYSTFPNLFLVIAIPRITCTAITLVSPYNFVEASFLRYCFWIPYIGLNLMVTRIFVCSLCAVFAFPDYRRALVQLGKRVLDRFIASRNVLFAKTRTSKVSVIESTV